MMFANEDEKRLQKLKADLGQAIQNKNQAALKQTITNYMEASGIKDPNSSWGQWTLNLIKGVITQLTRDHIGALAGALQETFKIQTKEDVEWIVNNLEVPVDDPGIKEVKEFDPKNLVKKRVSS